MDLLKGDLISAFLNQKKTSLLKPDLEVKILMRIRKSLGLKIKKNK